ncbi:MAG: DEAD/DEAH box helicase [Sarcina sp.]
MKKEDLIKIFNKSITGKKHIEALRVIENDLITESNIEKDEFIVLIKSNVISDNLMSSYSCEIEIDNRNSEVISAQCTCDDYEKNEFTKKNYCCKHLVATFYRNIDDILEQVKNNSLTEEVDTKNKPDSYLSMLLSSKNKVNINFEVYIEKEPWKNRIRIFLKIGSRNNKYVIRDIEQFWVHYINNIPLHFGKNYIFDLNAQNFSYQSKNLLDIMDTIFEMKKKNLNYIDGKYIYIPEFLIKTFFEKIDKLKVYLCSGFFQREVLADIKNKNPEIDFSLKLYDDGFKLRLTSGLPKRFTYKNDVFQDGANIYIANGDFIYDIDSFLNIFEKTKEITFELEEEEEVITRLIPTLRKLTNNLKLSKNILDLIIEGDENFKFYIDRINDEITLTVNRCYPNIEFNLFSDDLKGKYIFRDDKKEKSLIALIDRIGFTIDDDKFVYKHSDDELFKLLKFEILNLQKHGEVFYSDRVKNIKNITNSNYNLSISKGKENYFDFKFDIAGVEHKEILKIVDALRNKLSYYKLKSGEFLDLENIELRRLVNLINACANSKEISKGNASIQTNKLMYLDSYLSKNDILLDTGNDVIVELQEKIESVSSMDYTLPKNLRATLREYQIEGFKWFKKLDFLGLSGILADDMGLGKTLQTISFIASKIEENNKSKTLIIAPTSLVYNWLSEFNKFTEGDFCTLNIGAKQERTKVLKEFMILDGKNVIITTYGLIKRDLDLYKSEKFDYIIIDEAQNIKNSKSQITKCIKELNSSNRFALTGTPIENNTLEIWSIFDFLMPGYLGEEVKFNTRFNKGLTENDYVLEELNRLINPFILRRLKRDVLEELPDKIFKDLYIPLNTKQRKAYGIYSKYIQSVLNKEDITDTSRTQASSIEILSYITKLRQLCLDPSIVLEDYTGDSSKIEALLEILDEKINSGSRILVFSQFTSVLKNIGKRLTDLNFKFSYLDGSVNVNKRCNEIEKFNNEDASIFLISTKAGGTGLNLTSADIVVHFDPWWNPAVEDQATDRAHRIGQTKAVEVIKIIAKDTIEEKIIALQNRKREMISKIIKDDTNELSFKDTFDDILELLK